MIESGTREGFEQVSEFTISDHCHNPLRVYQRLTSLSRGISEGNDQTAERGAATGVGLSSLDREHPTAMKDCCA
nr:hypothetical protein BaRGS_020771 [Batillaria attramentaria]